MNTFQIIGFAAALVVIIGMAVFSGFGRKKKSGERSNGTGIVAGVIMGTLVGGSSTVGTAQLAYKFGMSAWWFTLGGGIACLILTLIYCKPFRDSGCPTLIGIIEKEYGSGVGLTASILSSVGTFINIISQLLAASAVLLVIMPSVGTLLTVLISAIVMILYVVFGGTKGAGMVGIVKLVLLYLSMIICGILALHLAGGLGSFTATVGELSKETGVNLFSVFARGAGTDLGSCLSLILGVLTTQTYAQAVITGKSDRAAKRGGLISAFMIPPIGIFGIIVGLYMRSVTDPSVFDAKTALTQFVLNYLPDLPAGIVLGTLFVASVGTGAGLALGIATIINRDIISKKTKAFSSPVKNGLLEKGLIIVILLIGVALSTGSLGDTILNFAFMSMGLRGAVIFIPLCACIWLKDRIGSKFALVSCIVSPILVLLFGTIWKGVLPVDSLFVGIAASIIIMGTGLVVTTKKKKTGT